MPFFFLHLLIHWEINAELLPPIFFLTFFTGLKKCKNWTSMGSFVFVSFLKVYVNMHCTDILAMECLLHSRDTTALDPRRLGFKPNDCLLK